MIDWIGCKLTKCPYGKEYGNCDTCENLIRKEDVVEPCDFCERATPLVTDKSGDRGISLIYPNTLSAYGYDIHGSNSNGICVKINYCPMCGRELEGEADDE